MGQIYSVEGREAELKRHQQALTALRAKLDSTALELKHHQEQPDHRENTDELRLQLEQTRNSLAEQVMRSVYDIVIPLDEAAEFERRKRWKVFTAPAGEEPLWAGVAIGVLGIYNSGKSHLLNRLCGWNLFPSAFDMHTMGLSVKKVQLRGRHFVLFDSAGLTAPDAAAPLRAPDNNEPASERDELRMKISRARQLQTAVTACISHVSNYVILMMTTLAAKDLEEVTQTVNLAAPNTDFIVVHNIRTLTTVTELVHARELIAAHFPGGKMDTKTVRMPDGTESACWFYQSQRPPSRHVIFMKDTDCPVGHTENDRTLQLLFDWTQSRRPNIGPQPASSPAPTLSSQLLPLLTEALGNVLFTGLDSITLEEENGEVYAVGHGNIAAVSPGSAYLSANRQQQLTALVPKARGQHHPLSINEGGGGPIRGRPEFFQVQINQDGLTMDKYQHQSTVIADENSATDMHVLSISGLCETDPVAWRQSDATADLAYRWQCKLSVPQAYMVFLESDEEKRKRQLQPYLDNGRLYLRFPLSAAYRTSMRAAGLRVEPEPINAATQELLNKRDWPAAVESLRAQRVEAPTNAQLGLWLPLINGRKAEDFVAFETQFALLNISSRLAEAEAEAKKPAAPI